VSHSVYFGEGNSMVFNRISDDRYEAKRGRFVVVREDGAWTAYVHGHKLSGDHPSARQAIEACKREAL
jgi:hypothetical protein